ncbi:PadR family transcriptional regulator [Streptomyces coffeae]|uniref:Helix-turn-helix transcriptional regulator n=1 Tax=Streptomyces coffeae TaxID=621382 RepID=A0ABS1NC96_9ACTN|nr:helix-turn-helix transcriptional regulator [Streptomyces coffeae]MBL1097692.1 helix-turn-helix transcriptional regulator [Streptomyces coffeae]
MALKPLTEPVFFVLLALHDAPRHGYGIKQEAAELSDGRVDLRVGTLYGVLDRLTADGLVEHDHDEVHRGRLRRYYRLTSDGRRALEAENARMAANVRAAERRLTGSPPIEAPTAPTTSTSSTSRGRTRPAGAGGTA